MDKKDFRCRWCGRVVVGVEAGHKTWDENRTQRELFEHERIHCELGRLRDQFAVAALGAMLTTPREGDTFEKVVDDAYDYANRAMTVRLRR